MTYGLSTFACFVKHYWKKAAVSTPFCITSRLTARNSQWYNYGCGNQGITTQLHSKHLTKWQITNPNPVLFERAQFCSTKPKSPFQNLTLIFRRPKNLKDHKSLPKAQKAQTPSRLGRFLNNPHYFGHIFRTAWNFQAWVVVLEIRHLGIQFGH